MLEPYAGKSVYASHGQRVVQGHRLMQSASDVFLGWTEGKMGRHFYIRQLRDVKIKFAIETFGSAEEFLVAARADPPGCLVVDIHLGRLSGFDLHERLTAAGLTIPTIFITAHDDAPTRERARRAGAIGYLRKPFDDDALIASVQLALHG